MKQGWTYKKLGEVATFMSGYTPDKSELFSQGKYPYFKVAEMNNPGNELFMRHTSLYIDSPKKVFPKGCIIFPKNGGEWGWGSPTDGLGRGKKRDVPFIDTSPF